TLGSSAVILRFNPSGTVVDARTWRGPGTYNAAYSLDLDREGRLIVVGTIWDYSFSPNHNQIFALKFDTNDALLWQRVFSDPAGGEAWGAWGSRVVRAD